MESYDYLSELSSRMGSGSSDRRLREAHTAMVELDRERGHPVCVWHAGCNTALMNSSLTDADVQDDAAEAGIGAPER